MDKNKISKKQSRKPRETLPPSAVPPPRRDCLYAILTPPGEAAIATFLLDGEGAIEKLRSVFRSKRKLSTRAPGQLVLGKIVEPGAGGRMVDEAVAAPLSEKESESGCEQVELSCHGGVGACANVERVLQAAGFRPAQAGELFARAHRAGRLSLPALEARIRLGRAVTARQTEFLLSHLDFQRRWERLGMQAALGARKKESAWREALEQAAQEALEQAPAARRLLRTHRVILAGPVNAGKSTLANRLLRSEQSIVSARPGTTRDQLERPAALRGLSMLLSDTAGLCSPEPDKPDAKVEQAARARAWDAAKSAALVLIVADGSRPPAESECEAFAKLARHPFLLVLNKADRGLHPEAEGLGFALDASPVRLSALTGEGLPALERALEAALLREAKPRPGAPFTERQRRCLEALRRGLQEGMDAAELVGHIRDLVSTRPNEAQLSEVFREAAEPDSGE